MDPASVIAGLPPDTRPLPAVSARDAVGARLLADKHQGTRPSEAVAHASQNSAVVGGVSDAGVDCALFAELATARGPVFHEVDVSVEFPVGGPYIAIWAVLLLSSLLFAGSTVVVILVKVSMTFVGVPPDGIATLFFDGWRRAGRQVETAAMATRILVLRRVITAAPWRSHPRRQCSPTRHRSRSTLHDSRSALVTIRRT
jgi:hypothetical protein